MRERLENIKIKRQELSIPGYERVLHVLEDTTGLDALIAIHSTKLGPALGGIRLYPYASHEAALQDVLRLAEGMTYKSAVAQTGTGGGKSVIRASLQQKTPRLLQVFGSVVESLGGEYICAEDVGINAQDLGWVRQTTKHTVGLLHDKSSGDPSPFTAMGAFWGMKSAWHAISGSGLQGKRIAIQGLGATGMKLAEYLFWEGAYLIVSDLDEDKCNKAKILFGAESVAPEEILFQECDVLAPCALGGVLSKEVLPDLQCSMVCGIANNQLVDIWVGDLLDQRGIVYIPDFIINAGGLINVCAELEPMGYHPGRARDGLQAIVESIAACFSIARNEGISMIRAAMRLVEERLQHGSPLLQSVCYHH